MSTDSKLEALRTGLEMAQELLAIKREALGDDYRLTRTYWEAERELQAALAEAEQEQAGEAQAACYIRSGWIEQLQGGKDCVMAALARTPCNLFSVPLYTMPQQPLSDEQAMAGAPPGITRHSYLQGFRDAERAHGITKEPKT